MTKLGPVCPKCGCFFANYARTQRMLARKGLDRSNTWGDRLFLAILIVSLLLLLAWNFEFI